MDWETAGKLISEGQAIRQKVDSTKKKIEDLKAKKAEYEKELDRLHSIQEAHKVNEKVLKDTQAELDTYMNEIDNRLAKLKEDGYTIPFMDEKVINRGVRF